MKATHTPGAVVSDYLARVGQKTGVIDDRQYAALEDLGRLRGSHDSLLAACERILTIALDEIAYRSDGDDTDRRNYEAIVAIQSALARARGERGERK